MHLVVKDHLQPVAPPQIQHSFATDVFTRATCRRRFSISTKRRSIQRARWVSASDLNIGRMQRRIQPYAAIGLHMDGHALGAP